MQRLYVNIVAVLKTHPPFHACILVYTIQRVTTTLNIIKILQHCYFFSFLRWLKRIFDFAKTTNQVSHDPVIRLDIVFLK